MNHFFAFIFLIPAFIQPSHKVTGVVECKNQTMPGCEVAILGSGNTTLTDIDGVFELIIPENQTVFSISLLQFAGIYAKTIITDIPTSECAINLGRVPIFSNKIIEAEEFDNLLETEQTYYSAMYSYHGSPKVLGYIHKNRIDTAQLLALQNVYLLSEEDWQYSIENNTLLTRRSYNRIMQHS